MERTMNCEPVSGDFFPIQPPLQSRPRLSEQQASSLAALFKTFSNSTRLRLLHALVQAGELRVTDLARATEMKPQAVSNQLQRLVDRGILASRRERTNVLYRIVDPCVRILLERGLCLLGCPPGTPDAEPAPVRGTPHRVIGEQPRHRVAGSTAAGSAQ